MEAKAQGYPWALSYQSINLAFRLPEHGEELARFGKEAFRAGQIEGRKRIGEWLFDFCKAEHLKSTTLRINCGVCKGIIREALKQGELPEGANRPFMAGHTESDVSGR